MNRPMPFASNNPQAPRAACNCASDKPTLLDQFAMAALSGILGSEGDGGYEASSAAERAYEMADAMLAERANRPLRVSLLEQAARNGSVAVVPGIWLKSKKCLNAERDTDEFSGSPFWLVDTDNNSSADIDCFGDPVVKHPTAIDGPNNHFLRKALGHPQT